MLCKMYNAYRAPLCISESVEVVFKARRLRPSSHGGLTKYAPCFLVVHGEQKKGLCFETRPPQHILLFMTCTLFLLAVAHELMISIVASPHHPGRFLNVSNSFCGNSLWCSNLNFCFFFIANVKATLVPCLIRIQWSDFICSAGGTRWTGPHPRICSWK